MPQFAPCIPRSLALAALAACSAAPSQPSPAADPRTQEVVLGTTAGWTASLALDLGAASPMWFVTSTKVFPQYGCADVVALDDLGRAHVLDCYSGRWTPRTTISDPAWLGAFAHGDVDARVPGRELYVAGRSGNVYAIVPHANGLVDNRWLANLDGREVHTLVAADVDAQHAGDELLAFTSPGALYLGMPRIDADGFHFRRIEDLPGRVRDAVVLPRAGNGPVEIATASRSGHVELLRFPPGSVHHVPVHTAAMGAGRIALRPPAAGRPLVLYSTRDDGSVWRHERGPADEFRSEPIHLGAQGPRGIAAGRFDPDPAVETVVVFGYSAKVELLRRTSAGWSVETLFTDRAKGHWIARAELDGRNATDEIVLTGYSGRIVALARPPGDGMPGALAAPAARGP
jgi:hypothetical protein